MILMLEERRGCWLREQGCRVLGGVCGQWGTSLGTTTQQKRSRREVPRWGERGRNSWTVHVDPMLLFWFHWEVLKRDK